MRFLSGGESPWRPLGVSLSRPPPPKRTRGVLIEPSSHSGVGVCIEVRAGPARHVCACVCCSHLCEGALSLFFSPRSLVALSVRLARARTALHAQRVCRVRGDSSGGSRTHTRGRAVDRLLISSDFMAEAVRARSRRAAKRCSSFLSVDCPPRCHAVFSLSSLISRHAIAAPAPPCTWTLPSPSRQQQQPRGASASGWCCRRRRHSPRGRRLPAAARWRLGRAARRQACTQGPGQRAQPTHIMSSRSNEYLMGIHQRHLGIQSGTRRD